MMLERIVSLTQDEKAFFDLQVYVCVYLCAGRGGNWCRGAGVFFSVWVLVVVCVYLWIYVCMGVVGVGREGKAGGGFVCTGA